MNANDQHTHWRSKEGMIYSEDDPSGMTLAQVRNEADADYIVKCCNSHEALISTLQAIRARIEGEWDNPALVSFGTLTTDTDADILRMIIEAQK